MNPDPNASTLSRDRRVIPNDAFVEYSNRVRVALERELSSWLTERQTVAASLHPEVGAVVEALRGLSTRGGKRFRAVLVAVAYEACGGQGGAARTLWAGVSMEVLQAYLLIHDDWMDGDEVRRGGPSVHAALRARFGDVAGGDAAAILAGDFGSALALEALTRVDAPAACLVEAMREFARMQCDVVLGQLLDIRGVVSTAREMEQMHALKTASYTARGPLLMGAALAGATADQRAALEAYAAPVGVAFQLRDDLLGVFGNPEKTGKPLGGDLTQGKRSAVVIEAEQDASIQHELSGVIGNAGASDAAIAGALEALRGSGVKQRVEARLEVLLAEATDAASRGPFTDLGRSLLVGAVDALGVRED